MDNGVCFKCNFAVLVNGSPTDFFKGLRGLRQGCPLSPLLFLLVVESFSRMMKKAKSDGLFSGLKVAKGLVITHLLFVDDVLILGIGSIEEWIELKKIISTFCQATGMEVNCQKSCFLFNDMEAKKIERLEDIFEIPLVHLHCRLQYLGFNLKPNDYKVSDWLWLLQKIEKRVGHWSFRWLSLGSRLVLIKTVLQNIPVYGCTLAKVPALIKSKIRQVYGRGQENPRVFISLIGI